MSAVGDALTSGPVASTNRYRAGISQGQYAWSHRRGNPIGDCRNMNAEQPSAATLDALRGIDTPTICNALEVVAPARRGHGDTVEPLGCPEWRPAQQPPLRPLSCHLSKQSVCTL